MIWQATGNVYLPWLLKPVYPVISVAPGDFVHDEKPKPVWSKRLRDWIISKMSVVKARFDT
jgi:hypothetical protein